MRGEWIEMKQVEKQQGLEKRSLPMRGEWIEISITGKLSALLLSLPMRGEWIEIIDRMHEPNDANGLSPCGESGLK